MEIWDRKIWKNLKIWRHQSLLSSLIFLSFSLFFLPLDLRLFFSLFYKYQVVYAAKDFYFEYGEYQAEV